MYIIYLPILIKRVTEFNFVNGLLWNLKQNSITVQLMLFICYNAINEQNRIIY